MTTFITVWATFLVVICAWLWIVGSVDERKRKAVAKVYNRMMAEEKANKQSRAEYRHDAKRFV